MAPLTLEGDTLGQRHRYYNKLVQEVLSSQKIELTEINFNDSDIENLLKIDTACKTRNVEYIIDVLKCSDMLYVSRAIKRSTWLINDTQHAHIIAPLYLFTQLFPHMNTKAVNKFLLHIRLNLKDQKRVEAFYEYLKDKTDESHKWLQNCSTDFIENIFKNGRKIPFSTFKRLCVRSFEFAKYHACVDNKSSYYVIQELTFLLRSHTEKYLNLIDSQKYCNPNFDKKGTEIIMRKFPNRILDNLEKYWCWVDLATVAKCLKKEDIKDFLYKNMNDDSLRFFFQTTDNFKYFIKNMSEKDRYQFIKEVFVDKTNPDNIYIRNSANYDFDVRNWYHLYEYLSFHEAFDDIRKQIRIESSPANRNSLLSVLIFSAKKTPRDINTLLQFYHNKHINEPLKFKMQFVNNVLAQIATHELDVETWKILDQLFHSLEVYTESKSNVQTCLKHIILYKVLHDENIPDIIEKKLEFDTFKSFQKILNEEQKVKLFTHLLNSIQIKMQNHQIESLQDFELAKGLLINAGNLVSDWNKSLVDYPFVLANLKYLIKIKKEKSWQTDFSTIYSLNKTWRKSMFDYSLELNPSDEVCINALKHRPQLLTQHDDQITALRANNSVSLRRVLTKLRIYWPDSIARQWTDAYLNNLCNTTETTAVIKGLFALLPQAQILDIAKKHSPEDSKIKWSEVDPLEINLRKNIAKTLYLARPQPQLDSVLWYAKGDYLQYAASSLNSIAHNMSKVQSRENIWKLLEGPVSLQKFGLELVFKKLNQEELREIFYTIWKTTKNSSIRTLLFKQTHTTLCKSNDQVTTENLWRLLNMFLDNLNVDESKDIYRTLSKIPPNTEALSSIRADFFKKSYMFLTSLPAKSNCQTFINRLRDFAPRIVHILDPEFVTNTFLAPVEKLLTEPRSAFVLITSAYLINSYSEEEQMIRYNNTLAPALDYAFQSWEDVHDKEYHLKKNFSTLIETMTWDFRKAITIKDIVIPTKLFESIEAKMEEKLNIKENYVMYTCWKLTTEYIKLVDVNQSILDNLKKEIKSKASDAGQLPTESRRAKSVWEDLYLKLAQPFGSVIVKCLKEDVDKYFPSIYCLFENGLQKMFGNIVFPDNLLVLETLKYMVLDEKFVPSFLVVCIATPNCWEDKEKAKRIELRNILASHSSDEVKVHYYKAFGHIFDSAT